MHGYHGQGSCLRQAAKPSPINRTQSQFSCKKTIPLDLWDVKGNCAKGRSKEALPMNRELDNCQPEETCGQGQVGKYTLGYEAFKEGCGRVYPVTLSSYGYVDAGTDTRVYQGLRCLSQYRPRIG